MPKSLHWARLLALAVVGLGALAAFIAIISLPTPTRGNIPNPLAPPVTESPRATMASFRQAVDAAEKIVHEAYKVHAQEPGWFQSAGTREKVRQAQVLLARAIRCFDLSDIPPNIRYRTGLEAAMQLEEIFERITVPNPDEIPDLDIMKTRTERGERPQWIVPNTDIRIVRVESGTRAGEYLFSGETVTRMYDFYRRTENIKTEDRFDFYAFYALSPGDLMPPKWYAYIEALPNWFLESFHDNARWQWLGLLATIWLAIVFCFAIYHWTWREGAAPWLPGWLKSSLLPLSILLSIWLAELFIQELNITGPVRQYLTIFLEIVGYVTAAWLVAALFNRMSIAAAASWGGRKQAFDTGIIRVTVALIGIGLATGILVFGANQIGVPLVGILAGLGVGGLAVALAAQPTLENFIGGIMIYTDRPVRVGDHCKFGDMAGVVEEIGIRSTRLRAPDRSLISIPNADFSKSQLVNYSQRDRLLLNSRIGLQYGASQEQISKLLDEMRAKLKADTRVEPGSVEVHLADFGGQSIEVEISAELRNIEESALAGVREELLMGLFATVEKSGAALTSHS